MTDSRLAGFYDLNLAQRLALLSASTGLDLSAIAGSAGLSPAPRFMPGARLELYTSQGEMSSLKSRNSATDLTAQPGQTRIPPVLRRKGL